MGRPSKLTRSQWEEVERRHLAGEKAIDLAKEFGISVSGISERFSKSKKKVKDAAKQIVETKQALAKLTVSEKVNAERLADELMAISMHMASAAKHSAATAHRLAAIANSKLQEMEDGPLNAAGRKTLSEVATITDIANKAAVIPSNLLSANKEVIKDENQRQIASTRPQRPRTPTYKIVTA